MVGVDATDYGCRRLFSEVIYKRPRGTSFLFTHHLVELTFVGDRCELNPWLGAATGDLEAVACGIELDFVGERGAELPFMVFGCHLRVQKSNNAKQEIGKDFFCADGGDGTHDTFNRPEKKEDRGHAEEVFDQEHGTESRNGGVSAFFRYFDQEIGWQLGHAHIEKSVIIAEQNEKAEQSLENAADYSAFAGNVVGSKENAIALREKGEKGGSNDIHFFPSVVVMRAHSKITAGKRREPSSDYAE